MVTTKQKIESLKEEYERKFWDNEKILNKVYEEKNEEMYQFHLGIRTTLQFMVKDLETSLK